MRRAVKLAFCSFALLGLLTAAPAVGQSHAYRRLAFSMDSDVYRIDLDGRNLRNRTERRDRDGQGPAVLHAPKTK
jgi:hypothetical protein